MRKIMRIAMCAAAMAAGYSGFAQARDLVFESPGGTYTEMMNKHFFTPFGQKKGMRVVVQQGGAYWGKLQAIVDTNQRPWDLAETEVYEQVRGCQEGLFEPLDLDAMGIGDLFYSEAKFDCGVGAGITAVTVAYDASKFATPPTSIEDFFDTDKFPGKRGLRGTAKYALELALMADGVAPGDLYDLLATPDGIDRAFAKLDTIKEDLIFWDTGAQSVQLLDGGDAVMTTAYSHRIADANLHGGHLGLIWDRAFLNHDVLAVLSGSEHADAAMEFIKFYADPEREAAFIKEMPMGPAMKKTMEMLPPDLVKLLPVGDNLKTAIDAGDEKAINFWLDNGDRITERWTAWISRQ